MTYCDSWDIVYHWTLGKIMDNFHHLNVLTLQLEVNLGKSYTSFI